MAKYLKIMVRCAQYSGVEDYDFIEVTDDFDPDNNSAHNEELWQCIDEAVANYVDTDYEILEGDFQEDEDF